MVSGLAGDDERNTRRYTGFTVGKAKTSFARQEYRRIGDLRVDTVMMLRTGLKGVMGLRLTSGPQFLLYPNDCSYGIRNFRMCG